MQSKNIVRFKSKLGAAHIDVDQRDRTFADIEAASRWSRRRGETAIVARHA